MIGHHHHAHRGQGTSSYKRPVFFACVLVALLTFSFLTVRLGYRVGNRITYVSSSIDEISTLFESSSTDHDALDDPTAATAAAAEDSSLASLAEEALKSLSRLGEDNTILWPLQAGEGVRDDPDSDTRHEQATQPTHSQPVATAADLLHKPADSVPSKIAPVVPPVKAVPVPVGETKILRGTPADPSKPLDPPPVATLPTADGSSSSPPAWFKEAASKDWLAELNEIYTEHESARKTKSAAVTTNSDNPYTLVSAIFDVGLTTLPPMNKRTAHPSSMTVEQLVARARVLFQVPWPKIIFTSSSVKARLDRLLPTGGDSNVVFEIIPSTQLAEFLPLVDAISHVRSDSTWSKRAGWLARSPNALLPLYLPLRFGKLHFLRRATELNPFKSSKFLWVDATLKCLEPSLFPQTAIQVYDKFTRDDHILLQTMHYRILDEVHGFEREAYYKYIGDSSYTTHLARSVLFGGSVSAIQTLHRMFTAVARSTLANGLLGNDETLLSILYYRFPEYFNHYDLGPDGDCAYVFSAAYGMAIIPPGLKGADLRGLECERDKTTDRDVCYMPVFGSNPTRRIRCPDSVNTLDLIRGINQQGQGQSLCQPDAKKDKWYCTVECQEGSNETRWVAHSGKWCEEQEKLTGRNPCGSKPVELSFYEFASRYPPRTAEKVIQNESGVARLLAGRGKPAPARLPTMTVGILCWRELDSLKRSMDTWARMGLFEYADEVLLFFNERNEGKEKAVAKYTLPPYNVKILGGKANAGLTWALRWLVGNSTSDSFIFMEKDFNLMEPIEEVRAQFDTGKRMLANNEADIVKYRSRYTPGDPNWADILFRGKEDSVFGRQPNLLCNFHHWLERPDMLFPDKIYQCNSSPQFYCSKAFFCNWTNNPVHFLKSWWMINYDDLKWKVHNPYDNIEYYMNWETGAWNERPWVLAFGEGVFTHYEIGE